MKINDKVFDKAKRALQKWGEDTQERLAVGEIGELLELYGKAVQNREADWTDEIADVYVILPALVMTRSSREKVEDRVEEKLDRLKSLLNDV